MEPTIFCVVGAPRSGATLVAQTLAALGIPFGAPERMARPLANLNDGGTMEFRPLTDLHAQIRQWLGREWQSTVPLPEAWWTEPAMAICQNALAQTAASEFANVPAWGWKDPLASQLLPLWEAMAAEQGIALRLVIPVRDPVAATNSLIRTFRLPIHHALRLWLHYTLAVREVATRHPSLFISYEGMLAHPEDALQQLATFAGRPPVAPGRIVRPELQNCRPRPESLDAMAGRDIAALYRQCMNQATTPATIATLADYNRLAAFFDFDQIDGPPRPALATVSWGDNNPKATKLIPALRGNVFEEVFPLPPRPEGGTIPLRFSPCQEMLCRCRIDKVETDGLYRGIRWTNSLRAINGWNEFDVRQPQYELDGDFSKASYIRITGALDLDYLTS